MDEEYETGAVETGGATDGEAPRESDAALVDKLMKRIKSDKHYFKKDFDQMRADMKLARTGRTAGWGEAKYAANIVGRHVKQKTAALYAKNPKAVAGRRETLDFELWDETPDSLTMAMQVIQQAQAAAAAIPQVVPAPEILPQVQSAQALIADVQQGMARRTQIEKTGKTLQCLFAYAMSEQQPVDFKTSMKQLVRRASTTGVGYIELAFERELATAPEVVARMDDAKARLAHIQALLKDTAEGEIEEHDAEAAELERTLADLAAQPEIVQREGLVFDFPKATRVIPDQNCEVLTGFVGGGHLTLEYLYSPDRLKELFGVDIGQAYTPYKADKKADDPDHENPHVVDVEAYKNGGSGGMVCVYKHYDKLSGLVYYIADGYPKFLREPAAPDVFVENFWPVYALTFNEVEDEDKLFPPSDVYLLQDMQKAYNTSRQGKREHRKAASPRWAYPKGGLEESDAAALSAAEPFSVTPINLGPNEKIQDKLQAIPVPGVDPNLYDTGEIFTDMQLVGGSQEANYGGVAKATATESAIAANATASSDSTSVDDLDAFLERVARASGQIMLREMSEDVVKRIVGPGAVWPEGMGLAEIADEIYLEVEAGSSGKPNQAVEIKNWQMMLPFLIQMPGVNPMWIARETVRRLDDKADLTEAVMAGMQSIISQNQQAQPAPSDPNAEPAAQGAEGADNGPAGPAEQQPGSDPAFGSNQVL
ncbi:hypothetical protein PhaeoP66_03213 [Phaeobacter inhibens]|uniref:Portal protein n=1 Tax=Phaeobacter inhibens TaxID=221822 RepID=A0ABM6RHZ2_9RHOB|nr:hypothetical protein [Phaeobacter inhibens]AUQ95955.1 hypothetical protein PhaeoP66_03213 [Phaeobacter inhibens]